MKCVYHLIKLKVKEAELRTKEKIENVLCFSRSFSEKVKNLTEKVVGWNWARKYLRALPPFFWVHILNIQHILHILLILHILHILHILYILHILHILQ